MSTPQLKKRKSEDNDGSSGEGEEQFFTPRTGWTPDVRKIGSKKLPSSLGGPRKHIRFDQLSSLEEKETAKERDIPAKSQVEKEEEEEEDSEAEPETTSFSRAETETKRQRHTIETQLTQQHKAVREKEKQRQAKRLAEKEAARKKRKGSRQDDEQPQTLLPSHLIDKFKIESIRLADAQEEEVVVSESSSPESEPELEPPSSHVDNHQIIRKGNILVQALPANPSKKTTQPRAQLDLVKKKAKMLVRPSQRRRPVRRRL